VGLRKYINDLEFSRKVNYSSMGKWFENGDFAKSIEFALKSAKEDIFSKKHSLFNRIDNVLLIPLFPLVCLGMYLTTKDIKKDIPSFYEYFSNRSDLILNHHLV